MVEIWSWMLSDHSGRETNMAMENGRCIHLLKMEIFQPAMLVYWRVAGWQNHQEKCRKSTSSNWSMFLLLC